jgi:redox-sensitive bicupin YhaK (pirin superfamily)
LPEAKFLRTGGQLHGVQLWVNLPAKDKLMRPSYQEIPSAHIPTVTTQDGLVSARVIAGEFLGTQAVITTRTPIMYIHLTVQPGGSVTQPVSGTYNVFGYIIDGEGQFGVDYTPAGDAQMVVFNNDSDTVSIAVPPTAHGALNMLLIAGKPLNEPVARYGPFVMNTHEEIKQAVQDYREGKFGNIDF